MPPNDVSYEIRSIPKNTVLVQGIYLGKDSSRFRELRHLFDLITDKLVDHDIFKVLEIKVSKYQHFWLYEQVLETSVNVFVVEDILNWYRQCAQKLFLNHNQLFCNTGRFFEK
ncbi:MAG: hypothetical protein ACYC4E_00345 [Carboxydocellales bacterium]